MSLMTNIGCKSGPRDGYLEGHVDKDGKLSKYDVMEDARTKQTKLISDSTEWTLMAAGRWFNEFFVLPATHVDYKSRSKSSFRFVRIFLDCGDGTCEEKKIVSEEGPCLTWNSEVAKTPLSLNQTGSFKTAMESKLIDSASVTVKDCSTIKTCGESRTYAVFGSNEGRRATTLGAMYIFCFSTFFAA